MGDLLVTIWLIACTIYSSGHVMPDFAQVYNFIGSVFDPNASGELQRLKQMDPINLETVLLLMRNLCVNLTSPEFEEQERRMLASYNGDPDTSSSSLKNEKWRGPVEGSTW